MLATCRHRRHRHAMLMSLHAHIQSMVWVEGGQSWRGGGAREAQGAGVQNSARWRTILFAGEARRGLTSVKLNEDIYTLRAGRLSFLLLPLPLSTLPSIELVAAPWIPRPLQLVFTALKIPRKRHKQRPGMRCGRWYLPVAEYSPSRLPNAPPHASQEQRRCLLQTLLARNR